MKKIKKHRKTKNANPRLSFAVGVGLILLGLALFGWWRLINNELTAAPIDRSVTPLAVNYAAPQIALKNINGKTESLADFSGQVVLINNWATWCPPCKAEMPTLQKYYTTHAPEGFNLIAVNAGEGKEVVAQFATNFKLTFTVWLDPDGITLDAFKNPNLPNSYVIDRAGVVRYAWTGEISMAKLEEFITPLIVEKK